MILPAAIDHQILPRIPLPLESESLQQGVATQVGGHIAGHDAMQSLLAKQIVDGGSQDLLHQPLPLMGLVDGIAQMACLEHAHHDVGEVAGGEYPLPFGIERHQWHGAAVEKLAVTVAQSPLPVTQGIETLVAPRLLGREVNAVALVEIQHQTGPLRGQHGQPGTGRGDMRQSHHCVSPS